MSNGTITLVNNFGRYDFDVTTFQLAGRLFAWNKGTHGNISYENLQNCQATRSIGRKLNIEKQKQKTNNKRFSKTIHEW
uniref:Uncharacterized protein n=1 Tax=Glossina pallidipes TaxID=7398 RepID=A0A1B0AC94_GLOPL